MHISIMLVFWPLVSFAWNSVVLAAYLLILVTYIFTYMGICTKYIILLKSGSPFHKRKLPLCHLFQSLFIWGLLFQGSFKSGVVNACLSRGIIDFTGFFRILQDTAMQFKKFHFLFRFNCLLPFRNSTFH